MDVKYGAMLGRRSYTNQLVVSTFTTREIEFRIFEFNQRLLNREPPSMYSCEHGDGEKRFKPSAGLKAIFLGRTENWKG